MCLHVMQPEMSIYNSELVLLSDVVDELIQDFVYWLHYSYNVVTCDDLVAGLCVGESGVR